jgi:hypothetical protein
MTHTHGEPQVTIARLVLLACVVAVALFNGNWFSNWQWLSNGRWSSPAFDPLLYLLTPFLRDTPLGTQMGFYYTTAASLSLLTFILSGVAAALYERLLRRTTSTVASLLIWLAAASLLTYPAYKAWQDAF